MAHILCSCKPACSAILRQLNWSSSWSFHSVSDLICEELRSFVRSAASRPTAAAAAAAAAAVAAAAAARRVRAVEQLFEVKVTVEQAHHTFLQCISLVAHTAQPAGQHATREIGSSTRPAAITRGIAATAAAVAAASRSSLGSQAFQVVRTL
jgi:hypothetical protein